MKPDAPNREVERKLGNRPCNSGASGGSVQRFVMRFRWHCRRAGGLFIGIRLHFPVSLIYGNDEVRNTWILSIGLLLATLECEYRARSPHNEGAKPQPR